MKMNTGINKATLTAATLTLGGLALAACGSSGTSVRSVVGSTSSSAAPAYRAALPAPVAEQRITQELAVAPAGKCAPQQVVPALLSYAPAGASATTCTAGVAERLAKEAEQEAYEASVPQSSVTAELAWQRRLLAGPLLAQAQGEASTLVHTRVTISPITATQGVVAPTGQDSGVVAWCGNGGIVPVSGPATPVTTPSAGEDYAVLSNGKLSSLVISGSCVIAAKGAAG